MGPNSPCIVISVYGFVKAQNSEPKEAATARICEAIFEELQNWPNAPVMILGDVNCNPRKVCPLEHQLTEGIFHDLGAIADTWGGQPYAPTARGHGARACSRLDFVFANRALLPQVRAFEVGPEGIFDVHRHVKVTLDTGSIPSVRQLAQPRELLDCHGTHQG